MFRKAYDEKSKTIKGRGSGLGRVRRPIARLEACTIFLVAHSNLAVDGEVGFRFDAQGEWTGKSVRSTRTVQRVRGYEEVAHSFDWRKLLLAACHITAIRQLM